MKYVVIIGLHTPHTCALLEPESLRKFMWSHPLKLGFLYTNKVRFNYTQPQTDSFNS
jgi:hypothetical protein